MKIKKIPRKSRVNPAAKTRKLKSIQVRVSPAKNSTKKPELGFSTKDIFYSEKGKISEKVMEISPKDPAFQFRRKSLEIIKKELKGKDLSMHTITKRLFTEKDKNLRDLEMNILKSEILACNFLGCKELIVHLKQEKLTKREVEAFEEILKFSKSHKVEIIYEMNGKFNGKNFIYNLNQFDNLKVNLDLGHLNTAIVNKTLKIPLEEFINKIKNKVNYIHAHNNNGEDDHVGLDKGSLEWKKILDQLDLSKVKKIIIELHNFNHYKSTKKLLIDYLK